MTWLFVPLVIVVRMRALRIWKATGLRSYYYHALGGLLMMPLAVLFAAGATVMVVWDYRLLALCLWGVGLVPGMVGWAIFLTRFLYFRYFVELDDYARVSKMGTIWQRILGQIPAGFAKADSPSAISKRKAVGQGILVLIACAGLYFIFGLEPALGTSIAVGPVGVAMIIMGLLYGT